MTNTVRIAVLDDYQQVSEKMADWDSLPDRAEVTIFNQHLGSASEVVQRLHEFQVICIMRERTLFPREVLQQLPDLQLLVTTGPQNAAIDLEAACECGVMVCGTNSPGHAASELAWGMILALSRHLVAEDHGVRNGLWQTTMGRDLKGQTLGVIGLGQHGSNIAGYGKAFGMRVIAWSENLTRERCEEVGVELVDQQTLLAQSDILSIHLKLAPRYRGLVDSRFLQQMKKTAYLVNTSRGPIINEPDLIEALKNNRIAAAGLDVYETEPLPANHPLTSLPNTILTSHVGFVTEQTYEVFYGETVKAINAWFDGNPTQVLT